MPLTADTLSHTIPDSVAQAANALHHSTQLGVLVFWETELIQIIGEVNSHRFSDYLAKTSLVNDAYSAIYPKNSYILSLGNMASALFLRLDEAYSLVIGPYRTDIPKCPMADPFFQKLSEEDRQEFMSLCSRFPLKTELGVQSIVQTAFALYHAAQTSLVTDAPVYLSSRGYTPPAFKPLDGGHNRMVKQIYAYVQEEENPNVTLMIRDLVCSGNAERAIEVYQKSIDHIARPLPNTECPRKQEVYHRIGLLYSIFYKMVESSVDHHSLIVLKTKYVEQLHRTRCTHEMDLITMDFLSAFSAQAKMSMQIESYTELIQKAIVYIYEHAKNKISLKDVAAALHVNACYLSSIFKKETGKSLTIFITELKVEEAKRLLDTTSFPITTICYEIGFDNPSYFTEVFKKVTGMTPKDYKTQAKTPQ